MNTIPPIEKNRELHAVVELARELKLAIEYTAYENDDVVVIRGTAAQKLAPSFQPIVKKGVIQGNQGPDGLKFVWDKALAADTPKEEIYPLGKARADEVLAAIPSRINTHDQMLTTCKAVRAKLDEAFPGVKIHHKGHGKGKWLTLQEAVLYLWVRTDGILNRAGMIMTRELLCHFETAPGIDYGRLGDPQLPAAFAE